MWDFAGNCNGEVHLGNRAAKIDKLGGYKVGVFETTCVVKCEDLIEMVEFGD